ncbi:MAG TPA: alanine racemase [Candidatus Limnocylindrales bacterium]
MTATGAAGAADLKGAVGETGARVLATRLPLIAAGPRGVLPPLPKTAWLEIDLDALVANVRLMRDLLPPGVRVEPVIKADAYGHGAVAVARALVADGIQSVGVATYDEALELRQGGIEVPIVILFPIPAGLAPSALRHCMAITVGDQMLLSRTLAALEAAPTAVSGGANGSTPSRLAIHLEVETGLGRGGVHPEEVPGVAAQIEANPRARLVGLWSHLQAADNTEITSSQDTNFVAASGLLEDSGVSLPARHISASGGVLAATAGTYDVVRVGLAQYGIIPDGLVVSAPNAVAAAALRPVMSLRARPVRVAWLEAGSGVSYGPTFTTERKSRIATLPLGYADGLPRSLSNKAQVLVRGMRVPQVGTVAMDAIMVDVTDVPGAAVTIDDEFTLIGEQGGERISAVEVAQWCNTISYEVVTAMSGRLPRVYYAASEAVAMRAVACDLAPDPGRTTVRSVDVSEDDPGPLGCE